MSQKLLKIGNSNFRIKYENTLNDLDMDTFVNGDDTKMAVSDGSSKQQQRIATATTADWLHLQRDTTVYVRYTFFLLRWIYENPKKGKASSSTIDQQQFILKINSFKLFRFFTF